MNKESARSKQSAGQAILKDELKAWEYDKYYLLTSVFIISGLYFYLIGNYLFFYQENQMLFVFSRDYLKQFASKPGGFLEYAGNFLSQGYFSNLYGALILAVVFTIITIIFIRINKKLASDKTFSLLFAVLSACLMILIQTNINFRMHNNLGILGAGLYFLISISFKGKVARITALALFPLFFWLTGAYAFIYLVMYTLYNIFRKEVICPACLLIIAGLTLLISKEVIFLQPWPDLLYYPMPLKGYFGKPLILWLFFLFFILYPVLVKLPGLIKRNENYIRPVSTWSILLTILLTIFVLSRIYNQDTANMFSLEKMFFARDWAGVIKQQEKMRSRNPVAEYYFNTALSESGMLCDKLFFAPQDYGPRSIGIAWNSQISMNKLFRGVYFYYSIGLINEAHRWAFESMVTEGYHPENIKLLIKTNMINGHYKVAEKYIGVLKKTLHYRNWVKKYEEMLRNPQLISADPELGEKIKLKPNYDFIVRIRNPQKNITSLLQSNPENKRAFEYNLAWLMLDKDFNGIVNEISKLSLMNYTKIPRHIEEAALLLRADMGPMPGFSNLLIGNETQSRFLNYVSLRMYFDRTKSPVGTAIQKEFGNTFWYYLDFNKPQNQLE
ncbi:MAG: DUF6057 family protein [Bacteroidota bacterium]|nr:DUF6057 family protein [Bacteroidota bacterium]